MTALKKGNPTAKHAKVATPALAGGAREKSKNVNAFLR
jgi:hypothetical protein